MKKDELMYQYAYEEYKQQLITRKGIRDRSAFLFGLSLPIISTLASASIATVEVISSAKIILLVLSGFFLVASLVFFLLLFVPSSQLKHCPTKLLDEIIGLYDIPKNKSNLEKLTDKDEFNQKEQGMAYIYFTNMYNDNINSYNDKHKRFKIFFIFLSITISLSYLFLVVSLGV